MLKSCLATNVGLLLLAGGLSMLQAGSYTVRPVRIELSPRQLRTTIQIENLGTDPLTVQAHIMAWNANGKEEVLSDNDEILLNPPIFTVPAGHQQYVRLGLRKPPADDVESTFRLILEEVPPAPKPGFNGITTLLKITVPIFFKPRASLPQLVWSLKRISNEDLLLTAQNSGNTHVQIRKLSLSAGDPAENAFAQGTVTYVLQKGRKEWVIHNTQLANAGMFLLEAQTDNGDVRENLVTAR
jgi:fimbrial chaperone protein